MDNGYLLTLSIHLAEIPTSPQNFGTEMNTLADTASYARQQINSLKLPWFAPNDI